MEIMNPMILEYLAKERILGILVETDRSRRRAKDRSHRRRTQSATWSRWLASAHSRSRLMGERFHLRFNPVSSTNYQPQIASCQTFTHGSSRDWIDDYQQLSQHPVQLHIPHTGIMLASGSGRHVIALYMSYSVTSSSWCG
jgi:hypothetical protein